MLLLDATTWQMHCIQIFSVGNHVHDYILYKSGQQVLEWYYPLFLEVSSGSSPEEESVNGWTVVVVGGEEAEGIGVAEHHNQSWMNQSFFV
jgi:hypothetical protein